jgi:hypothetical protein
VEDRPAADSLSDRRTEWVESGLADPGDMPSTDHTLVTVASLLVTIHRDEHGAFYATTAAMAPDPRMTQPADLADYAPEPVARSHILATAPNSARAARWRRCLITAAAVAVLAGGAAALHMASGPAHSRSQPGQAVPTALSTELQAVSARCPDAGGSACSDETAILQGLGPACTNLVTTAAHALDDDPQQYAQTVLATALRSGKPLAASFANGSPTPEPTSSRPATPTSISRQSCKASTRRSPRPTPAGVHPTAEPRRPS